MRGGEHGEYLKQVIVETKRGAATNGTSENRRGTTNYVSTPPYLRHNDNDEHDDSDSEQAVVGYILMMVHQCH